MSRLKNARSNHLAKWVLPTASRLLIDGARKDALTKPLEQVAHVEMGQSPVGDCYNRVRSGVPFIGGPADLGLVFPEATRWIDTPTKLCKHGDIIVCVRATIGEPRWADTVYCLGRGVAGVRARDSKLDQGFLFRIIQGSEDQLREQGSGTTFKTISKEHIENIQVPMIPLVEQQAIRTFLTWIETTEAERLNFSEAPDLPEAFEKERRIIARIEELSAKIEEARILRRKASEESEALAATTSQEILSGSWHQARLEDVCPVITDGTHQTPRYTDDGAIFLSAQNVKPFRFMPEKHRKVSAEDFRFYTARNKPKRGDVLLTRVGAGIGEAAVVDQDIEFAIYVSLALIRTDSTRLLPEFLAVWLNSPAGRAVSRRETLGRGTSQGNLNLKLLRGVELPIPPLPEQRRIVAHLDDLQAKVDTVEKLQDESEAELNALMPSILSRAFAGEL